MSGGGGLRVTGDPGTVVQNGVEVPLRFLREFNRVVSSDFRERLLEALPGLRLDPGHCSLAGHLLFGRFREETCADYDGRALVTHQFVASIYGRWHDLSVSKRYASRDDLARFSRDVLPLDVSDFRYTRGLCRSAGVCFPDSVLQAVEAERSGEFRSSGRVYLRSGSGANARRLTREDEREKTICLDLAERSPCSATREVLEYMNGLGRAAFSRTVTMHMAAAERFVRDHLEEPRRSYALDVLRSIEVHPQPLYHHTERSVRVFGMGGDMLSLPREVRQVLLRDWHEVDLRCAQVAINAKLWKRYAIYDFLKQGGDVWETLISDLGLGDLHGAKDSLKTATYALCFGKNLRSLKRELGESLGVAGVGGRFLDHWLVKELISGRAWMLDRILADGGAEDCFGRWIPYDRTTIDGVIQFNRNSILAQLAQAVELKLLLPVIRAAKACADRRDHFRVYLWQHDGFSLISGTGGSGEYSRGHRGAERWLRKVCRLVDETAKKMDVATALVVK